MLQPIKPTLGNSSPLAVIKQNADYMSSIQSGLESFLSTYNTVQGNAQRYGQDIGIKIESVLTGESESSVINARKERLGVNDLLSSNAQSSNLSSQAKEVLNTFNKYESAIVVLFASGALILAGGYLLKS
jgi:hypothetical protein